MSCRHTPHHLQAHSWAWGGWSLAPETLGAFPQDTDSEGYCVAQSYNSKKENTHSLMSLYGQTAKAWHPVNKTQCMWNSPAAGRAGTWLLEHTLPRRILQELGTPRGAAGRMEGGSGKRAFHSLHATLPKMTSTLQLRAHLDPGALPVPLSLPSPRTHSLGLCIRGTHTDKVSAVTAVPQREGGLAEAQAGR